MVAVVLLAAAVEEAEEVRKILYIIDHAAVGPGGNGLCAERLIARLSNAAVVSSWPVNISYKTCDQRQERREGCGVRKRAERARGTEKRRACERVWCVCMHADVYLTKADHLVGYKPRARASWSCELGRSVGNT